jgi:hypothetical protein
VLWRFSSVSHLKKGTAAQGSTGTQTSLSSVQAADVWLAKGRRGLQKHATRPMYSRQPYCPAQQHYLSACNNLSHKPSIPGGTLLCITRKQHVQQKCVGSPRTPNHTGISPTTNSSSVLVAHPTAHQAWSYCCITGGVSVNQILKVPSARAAPTCCAAAGLCCSHQLP